MSDEVIMIVESTTVIDLPRKPRPAGIYRALLPARGLQRMGRFRI